jgi:hypothetical protein
MDGGSGLTVAIRITAIVGIFTLIINRGTKVSELRQVWINDQRADFGKWAAAALSLARNLSVTSRAADFAMLEEAAYRIRLRENPGKREWALVLQQMDAVREKLLANASTPFDVFPDVKDIADEASIRLKKDWNKVRRGEAGYKTLVFLFPALFAALLVMTVWAVRPDMNPLAKDSPRPVEQHITGSLQLLAPPAATPASEPSNEAAAKR